MRFPSLTEIPSSSQTIDTFGGYNHNERIGENEFFDMKNMTSDLYPLLAPRKARGNKSLGEYDGYVAGVTELNGKWYVVAATNNHIKLYEDGVEIFSKEITVFPGTKRQIVSMGSKLVIFPDEIYIDTVPQITQDGGPASATYTSGKLSAVTETEQGNDAATSFFQLCTADGTIINDYATSKPETAEEGQYWVEKTTDGMTLKQWSNGFWSVISSAYTYIKISYIWDDFKAGDGVHLSYRLNSNKDDPLKETSLVIETVAANVENYGDYLIVKGLLDAEYSVPNDNYFVNYYLKIERRVPKMDYVIESGNRLWGCKHGKIDGGKKTVNEIYASALGDPTNWNVFEGTSMDSYAMSLGSEGEFTGAASFRGNPVFFKENYIHRIYGNYPSNYQLQSVEARGVQKGSSSSIATINEVLYYKSVDTICAYEGTMPTNIGKALGNIKYTSAVGGGHHDKYFVSMRDESDKRHMFVYDTVKGMWHKEDNIAVTEFVSTTEELYMLPLTRTEKTLELITVHGTGDSKVESKVEWYAATGRIGLGVLDGKRIRNMRIRMSVGIGANVRISIEYDSSGHWEQVYFTTGTKTSAFNIPIKPKKCDHFRIKIEGDGEAKLYALEKIIEYGGIK